MWGGLKESKKRVKSPRARLIYAVEPLRERRFSSSSTTSTWTLTAKILPKRSQGRHSLPLGSPHSLLDHLRMKSFRRRAGSHAAPRRRSYASTRSGSERVQTKVG